MRFQTTCNTFADALERVLRAVPNGSAEPIFKQVYMEVDEGGRASLVGSDKGRMLRVSFGVDESEAGAIAMDSKRLKAILPRIKKKHGNVELSADDKLKVSMAMGSTSYKVNGNPAKNFPALPVEAEGPRPCMSMEPSEFFKLLTWSRIPGDGLSGQTFEDALIELFPSSLRITSTDAVRLVIGQTFDTPLQEKTPHIGAVPRASLKNVDKLFKHADSLRVELGADTLTLKGRTDSMELSMVCRLSEATFPRYRQIIKGIKSNPNQVTCGRQAMVEALKDLLPIAEENKNKIGLRVDPLHPDDMRLTAVNPEIGEASASVACDARGEDKVELSFNAKFILDFLEVVKACERVSMGLRGSHHPALFRVKEEPGLNYILMPVNL